MSDRPSGEADLPRPLRPPLSRNVSLLLESRIPARLAWVGKRGQPRVVPMWFHWTGNECVITSFAGADKLGEISSGTEVTVTIDTETFPYRGLRMSGRVSLEPSGGLTEEYRLAAARYLGSVAGRSWCESLEGKAQVAMRLRPTHAVVSDMSRSPFLAEPDGGVRK